MLHYAIYDYSLMKSMCALIMEVKDYRIQLTSQPARRLALQFGACPHPPPRPSAWLTPPRPCLRTLSAVPLRTRDDAHTGPPARFYRRNAILKDEALFGCDGLFARYEAFADRLEREVVDTRWRLPHPRGDA